MDGSRGREWWVAVVGESNRRVWWMGVEEWRKYSPVLCSLFCFCSFVCVFPISMLMRLCLGREGRDVSICVRSLLRIHCHVSPSACPRECAWAHF